MKDLLLGNIALTGLVRWMWVAICLCLAPSVFTADEVKNETDQPEASIQERIQGLDLLMVTIDQQVEAVRAEWIQLQHQAADLKLKLDFLEGSLQSLDANRREHTLKIEELLKQSGDWISFSQHVAPIFQNHCIACHNARNPQGRYTMATYSHLMSDGESGSAIHPGQAAESYLLQLITDGSMPKDAPALESSQIELVRKWIDQGARLDSGVATDTPLFRLAPRVPHPPAPEVYPGVLPVTAVAISPGNDLMATSGYHEVLLWSYPEGQLCRRIGNVAQRVHSVAFHPDGQRLAVASGTPGRLGELKLFDVQTGELLEDLWVSHDSVLCLAFSPDGQYLACGDTTGSIVAFSLDGGAKQKWLAQDHSDWVNSLAWSSDGTQLVSSSRDRTCKVLDARTGSLLLTFSGHQQNVTSALFDHDGQHVISAGQEPSLRIWRTDDGVQAYEWKELSGEITCLVLMDRSSLLVCSSDRRLQEVDIHKRQWTTSYPTATDWNLCAAAFTGERKVVFGSHSGRLSLIDLDDPSQPPEAVQLSWLVQPGFIPR